jgi:hypothetical protein
VVVLDQLNLMVELVQQMVVVVDLEEVLVVNQQMEVQELLDKGTLVVTLVVIQVVAVVVLVK